MSAITIFNTIMAWKSECNVQDLAIDIKEKILHVYADRPGALIGKAGSIADKYIKEIKKDGTITDVEIHEVVFMPLSNIKETLCKNN